MKKRIFSRLMAMIMAVALLSTTALTVDLNQAFVDDESNWSEEYGRKYITLTDSEYTVTEDITTDRTLKFSNPNGYNSPQFEATLDLKGHTIDHGGVEGSVIRVDGVVTLTVKDTSAEESGKITGGNERFGGGVELAGGSSSLILEGGNITENKANYGGGVGGGGGSTFIMSGGSITNNEAENAGAVYLHCGGIVEITGGIITGNTATKQDQWSDALYDGIDAWTGSISGNAAVCGNGVDGKGINVYWGSKDNAQQAEPCYHYYLPATCTEPSKCKGCGEVVPDSTPLGHQHTEVRSAEDPNCEEAGYTGDTWCMDCNTIIEKGTDIAPTGHTSGAPVEENRVEAQPGVSGSYDLVVRCTVCNEIISSTPGTIPALPMPIDFGDFTGGTGAGAGTTITDETTPLAGIVTEAQLLDELYKHEGSPAVETVEKYASHEYAPAISWALANAIVVDDEEFDPDEIVTVALLREVLVNFVEYTGIDFTVVVDGEDEDLVLDLSERLTVFFAQLEK